MIMIVPYRDDNEITNRLFGLSSTSTTKLGKIFTAKLRTQAALQQVKLVKCICYDRISDAKIAHCTQNLIEVIKQDNWC